MHLVDSHCHIHSAGSKNNSFTVKKWHEAGLDNPDDLIESAKSLGVDKLICVGTDYDDAREAVSFVQSRSNCWASVGVHPHEADKFLSGGISFREIEKLSEQAKVIAIGEVGLDYFYEHSKKSAQIKLLEMFCQLAVDKKLPLIFHVRDAFSDFWPIFDNFSGLYGVLHSFTDSSVNMEKALSKDLYIGLNGIMTFTKDKSQIEVAKAIPVNRLLLETDAPYLTPKPFRGKICKPEHVILTARFLSDLRGEKTEELTSMTTKNACELFGLK